MNIEIDILLYSGISVFILLLLVVLYRFYRRRRALTLNQDNGILSYNGLSQPLNDEENNHNLPPGWVQYYDQNSKPYYFNQITGQTQLIAPTRIE